MAAVRILAVTNQKGGVGKTTTVANLAAALAVRGLRVCAIDLDPQANLTMYFGIDPADVKLSVYDVLTGQATLGQVARQVQENLTLVPAVIDLAAAEVELAAEVGREQVLNGRLAAEELGYDLILIDCPPSLGLLTLNALAAAQEVLIPLQPHFLALQGLGRLLETVGLVAKRINPPLKVLGVVFCMYESATKLANEVVQDVTSFFAAPAAGAPWGSAKVFATRIRRNIKLAESPSYGATILTYEPLSHGAKDYTALADEFMSLTGLAGAARPEAAAADSKPVPAESSEHGHVKDSVAMPPAAVVQPAAIAAPTPEAEPTPPPPHESTHGDSNA